MPATTLLVVDDNDSVRQGVAAYCQAAGFTVFEASNARAGYDQACLKKPTAIVMDLNLPDHSGFEAVAALKKNPATSGIPVLVFTAHHRDGQLIESREYGADGYLVKGGPLEELVGYVQLLIKSAASPRPGKLSLGDVTIDLQERTVKVGSQLTPALTPKEFDLLVLIAERSPQVFPWEKIAKAIWNQPEKYGKDSKTIELHAQRLRKKLGPDGGRHILTHKGVGLQFLPVPPAAKPL